MSAHFKYISADNARIIRNAFWHANLHDGSEFGTLVAFTHAANGEKLWIKAYRHARTSSLNNAYQRNLKHE